MQYFLKNNKVTPRFWELIAREAGNAVDEMADRALDAFNDHEDEDGTPPPRSIGQHETTWRAIIEIEQLCREDFDESGRRASKILDEVARRHAAAHPNGPDLEQVDIDDDDALRALVDEVAAGIRSSIEELNEVF